MGSRVALVHDFLLDLRGAERVFAAICDAWPEADVFTAVYDERGHRGALRRPRARSTSFLQRLRPTARTFRAAAAALSARRRVARPARLRHRHLVLERVGARRARRPRRGARLLLPQPVPLRLVRARGDAARPAARSSGPPLRVLLSRWRQWDWIAAQRVDRYVANSTLTAARVRRYFGREATVLHPPVELERFAPGRGRRALPRAGRADGAQAHRRRDPGVQRAAAGRSSWSATGRSGAGCGGWPGRPCRFTGRLPDARGRRRCCAPRRALVVTAAGGVRDRRGRGAGLRAARDRAARGRRARERARRA